MTLAEMKRAVAARLHKFNSNSISFHFTSFSLNFFRMGQTQRAANKFIHQSSIDEVNVVLLFALSAGPHSLHSQINKINLNGLGSPVIIAGINQLSFIKRKY